MGRRKLRTGIALSMIGVTCVALTTSASADPGNGFVPDDNPHSWCFGANIETWEYDQVFSKMSYIKQYTDVDTKYDSTCNWSAGSMTDMHIMDIDLAPGVRGQAQCTGTHWYGSCDRFDIRVDEAEIYGQSVQSGLPFRKNHGKTFCHEIGHTMGLRHYNKNVGYDQSDGVLDCMVSGEVNAADIWQQYSFHHISHVNITF